MLAFIPFLGAVLSAIPAVAVAFIQGPVHIPGAPPPGPEKALLVFVVYTLVPRERLDRLRDVILKCGQTLRGWLAARLLMMVVIGVLFGSALALLGIRP